jgi:hypothetical protein
MYIYFARDRFIPHTKMSDPVHHTVTFGKPSYLTSASGPGVSAVFERGGLLITEALDLVPTFVDVDGPLLEITFKQEGKDVTLRPTITKTVGPYAWGIFQPIDGGVIGYSLEITEQDGTSVDIPFARFNPTPPGGLGAADPPNFPLPTIYVKNGAVYNGLSGGFLSFAYTLIGGPIHVTDAVLPGKETGPVPFTGWIQRFRINLEGGEPQNWFPERGAVVQDGYPIAVLGNPTKPFLAVFREVGPALIIALSKDIPEA